MTENRTPERRKTRARPPRTTPRKWAEDRRNNNLSSDDRSKQSSDGAESSATPSSVLINGYPMVKDLSDLSGSYLNGNTAPRSSRNGGVPGSVYQSDGSDTSYNRPWLLAKILSSREPVHPQPPQDCNDSVGVVKNRSMVVVDNCGQLEIVHNETMSLDSSLDVCRVPLLLLLMDPQRKMYELLQIWVDPHQDTVRDVLHAIQINLGESWRQDYDGIFQVRNNHFSQLIHILNVIKYDVRPYELWVAKPWSMSAKNTVGYASGVLNHLKSTGVLVYSVGNDAVNTKNPSKSSSKGGSKPDDSALVLSKEAIARTYVPGGILKHHHACQFLSFSPPFEAPAVRVDVLGGDDQSFLSDGLSAVSDPKSGKRDEASKASHASNPSKASNHSIYPLEEPLRDRNFDIPPVVKENGSILRKIARLLATLNCASRRRRAMSRGDHTENLASATSDTMMMESAVGDSLWRLIETEVDDSVASVVSDTAPLLFSSSAARSTRRVYMGEI